MDCLPARAFRSTRKGAEAAGGGSWSLAFLESTHGVIDGLLSGDERFRALHVASDVVFEVVEIGERCRGKIEWCWLAEVDEHLACSEAILKSH